jgi:GT2 family glycosyltransferase
LKKGFSLSPNCVILANYEGRKRGFLDRCIETIQNNLQTEDVEVSSLNVIIVDDGSKDDSMAILRDFEERKPNQVTILHTRNLDVTSAMNYGMTHVFEEYPECRFVMVLDVDIALSESFLSTMINVARKAPKRVGMLASNQYMLKDFPRQRLHRSTGHYVDTAGATLDRDFRDKEKSRQKEILCPCLSGALFKTEMLKEVGLVPEEYIHYNNCSELGFRAQISNWQVNFVKSAVMWHNWRHQDEITCKQKENRELTRIWNILRFFPEGKIDNALNAYKNEKYKTSPTGEEKIQLIKEAKERSFDKFPRIPEEKKKRVYQQFIAPNAA